MICLDTTVLIRGVQHYSTLKKGASLSGVNEDEQARIERAGIFLERAQADKIPLMLPTPVIAEYLTGLSEEAAMQQLGELEDLGSIYPLDAAAALMTANLFRRYRERHGQRITRGEKPRIKTDAMILSIAIVHGASSIYTHDAGDFEALCIGRDAQNVKISEVPSIIEQGILF